MGGLRPVDQPQGLFMGVSNSALFWSVLLSNPEARGASGHRACHLQQVHVSLSTGHRPLPDLENSGLTQGAVTPKAFCPGQRLQYGSREGSPAPARGGAARPPLLSWDRTGHRKV